MFTKHDINRLIQAADLPGYEDKSLLYSLLSKQERLRILQDSRNEDNNRRVAAAIELQRVWRGYRTRTKLFTVMQPQWGNSSCISSNNSSLLTISDLKSSLNLPKVGTSLLLRRSRLQLKYDRYIESALHRGKMKQELQSFQEFCACIIQTWWKNIFRRKRNEKYLAGKKKKLTKEDAVILIQRAWRRHIDKQVFEYYKDLINFRSHGDPSVILRCINPRECELLDSGSGVHVRFRLGGLKFPPSIFYKISSHINVADLGAFAPKNYVKRRMIDAKFLHNRGIDANDCDGGESYERLENNGWRHVCDSFSHQIFNIFSMKKIKHPPEKLVRKQDAILRKKRKKIEWMKKMYESGQLQCKLNGHDDDVRHLIETAARGIVSTFQENGVEDIDDWEVDEILQWTQGLDYYSYLQDWQSCGTTHIKTENIESNFR